jgi:hypothetical protein
MKSCLSPVCLFSRSPEELGLSKLHLNSRIIRACDPWFSISVKQVQLGFEFDKEEEVEGWGH